MNEQQRNPFLNLQTFGTIQGFEAFVGLKIAEAERQRRMEKEPSVRENSGKWTFRFPRRLWRRRQVNRVSAQ